MSSAPIPTNEHFLARIAQWCARASGSTPAFIAAVSLVIGWLITGPIFSYSNTWQLVINTFTTIVTFLMVFLIQRAQNKDAQAIHLKLNELVASVQGASNRLINAENLTEHELKVLHKHYATLIRLSKEEAGNTNRHSVEEALERHESKQQSVKAHEKGHKRVVKRKKAVRQIHA